jgi:Uma2 family endonuclease
METLPKSHRFSGEEFHLMDEAGLFREKSVELIEGEIIDMPPTGHYHGGASNRLNWMFGEPTAKGRWIVSVQNSLALSSDTEPQPDLMLLKPRPTFYTDRLPIPEDVFLLIEISHASIAFDRDRKVPLYGRAGITEVWILNLGEGVLEVYREPHFTGYASVKTYKSGQTISPALFRDVKLKVSELLIQGV